MTSDPFAIFAPYRDQIDVRFFPKEDHLSSDADTERVLGTNQFVSLNQVHKDGVVIARSPSRREKDADAVVTDQEDLWLVIRIADCQAFVVYAPDKNVIGLVHAGWKGLVHRIIPTFVETLKREWGIDPSTLLIGAVPSLCMQHAEFTDPVKELVGIDPKFFDGRHADLQAIADDQWVQAGVNPAHLERHPDCTQCQQDLYWSFRGSSEVREKEYRNLLTCCLKKRK